MVPTLMSVAPNMTPIPEDETFELEEPIKRAGSGGGAAPTPAASEAIVQPVQQEQQYPLQGTSAFIRDGVQYGAVQTTSTPLGQEVGGPSTINTTGMTEQEIRQVSRSAAIASGIAGNFRLPFTPTEKETKEANKRLLGAEKYNELITQRENFILDAENLSQELTNDILNAEVPEAFWSTVPDNFKGMNLLTKAPAVAIAVGAITKDEQMLKKGVRNAAALVAGGAALAGIAYLGPLALGVVGSFGITKGLATLGGAVFGLKEAKDWRGDEIDNWRQKIDNAGSISGTIIKTVQSSSGKSYSVQAGLRDLKRQADIIDESEQYIKRLAKNNFDYVTSDEYQEDFTRIEKARAEVRAEVEVLRQIAMTGTPTASAEDLIFSLNNLYDEE